MTDTDTQPLRESGARRAGMAVLLSLFATGAGHIYAGRGRRGAILFGLALAHVPFLVLLSYLSPSGGVLWTLLGGLVLFGALFLFALIDAGRVAANAPVAYVPRVYNNRWLYVGLIVLSTAWQVGGMAWARTHAFEAFHVPTQSMAPTVAAGDRILVNKNVPGQLERGSVVVFRRPGRREITDVKRVIGLPGETLSIVEGVVHIDGRPLSREAGGRDELIREASSARSWQVLAERALFFDEVTVPEGHVFLLGDNREHSNDSRAYGSVPLGDVAGVVEYVFWPGSEGRFGTLD